MQIPKRYSRFFVSLTVFEIFGSGDGLSGTPEFTRPHWCRDTVGARILKFGRLIELVKANILCNYAEAQSRIPWVPEGNNCFSAKHMIFPWSRRCRHTTFLDRSMKFGMMIHLNEYYISFHYNESLSPTVCVPERKNWFFPPKIDWNREKSTIFGGAPRSHSWS